MNRPDDEAKLTSAIANFVYDPLGFVQFAYPWQEPGVLEAETGPDEWQNEMLTDLGRQLISVARTKTGGAILFATSSGHGVGKSALVAWVIQWFSSTRPHPQIIVTANTREQLLKKTFREVSVWHKRLINKHWFEWTATKFYHKDHPETWFAAAVPWSKEHSEGFAGTHEKHVLIIFDEASGIDDKIWEVTEGALTTPGAIWLVFGNPTRNTGRFRECFGRYKHRWHTRKIDSRTAKMTNKEQLQQWVDDYGEDSDFVRIRVRGEFPRAGSAQFISSEDVERAGKAQVPEDPQATKILSVDVARFGDDQTIILKREGNRVLPLRKFRGLDTMQVAAMVAETIDDWQPDGTFVDGTGLGAGVVDRLRALNYRVIEVLGGSVPDDPLKYFNKRAEMWGRMRDWLKGDVSIPDDDGLRTGLTGLEYGYSNKLAIQLEKKGDMKARGLASPDEADALSMSFAEPVRAHREILLPAGYQRSSTRSSRRPGNLRKDLNWRVL